MERFLPFSVTLAILLVSGYFHLASSWVVLDSRNDMLAMSSETVDVPLDGLQQQVVKEEKPKEPKANDSIVGNKSESEESNEAESIEEPKREDEQDTPEEETESKEENKSKVVMEDATESVTENEVVEDNTASSESNTTTEKVEVKSESLNM